MARAILLALFLGYFWAGLLFWAMRGFPLEQETKLILTALAGVLAGFFGRLYWSGLRRGPTLTPPVSRRAWRVTFAIVLSLWAVIMTPPVVSRCQELLDLGSREQMANYRQSVQESEAAIERLEAEQRNGNRSDLAPGLDPLGFERARLQIAQESLRLSEAAVYLAALGIGGTCLFVLGTIAAWVVVFRGLPASTAPSGDTTGGAAAEPVAVTDPAT